MSDVFTTQQKSRTSLPTLETGKLTNKQTVNTLFKTHLTFAPAWLSVTAITLLYK